MWEHRERKTIVELSFNDFLQLVEEKKLDALAGKNISIIGKILHVGDKVLTFGNPENENQKIFLISYNQNLLEPLKQEKTSKVNNIYARAIIHVDITAEDNPVFVLDKIHILQKFNSKIYMKLLELEKDIVGELYGKMDRDL